MSEPFVGEVRLVSFTTVPGGWAECNGQLLAISQFEELFTVIGTTYGGDGQSTFALPDFRGRVPVHAGQGDGLPDIPGGEAGAFPSGSGGGGLPFLAVMFIIALNGILPTPA